MRAQSLTGLSSSSSSLGCFFLSLVWQSIYLLPSFLTWPGALPHSGGVHSSENISSSLLWGGQKKLQKMLEREDTFYLVILQITPFSALMNAENLCAAFCKWTEGKNADKDRELTADCRLECERVKVVRLRRFLLACNFSKTLSSASLFGSSLKETSFYMCHSFRDSLLHCSFHFPYLKHL